MAPKKKTDPSGTLPPTSTEPEVLLAFDCSQLLDEAGPLPLAGVYHRRFADLDSAMLTELKPTRIILPLFAAEYDAVAAIETLQKLEFLGQITVMAPDLPRPRLVERELRGLGPGPRLTLISP